MNEIGVLLCSEVLSALPLETIPLETLLATMEVPCLAAKKFVFAPIWGVGEGFAEGMLSLVPSAPVAQTGLDRAGNPPCR